MLWETRSVHRSCSSWLDLLLSLRAQRSPWGLWHTENKALCCHQRQRGRCLLNPKGFFVVVLSAWWGRRNGTEHFLFFGNSESYICGNSTCTTVLTMAFLSHDRDRGGGFLCGISNSSELRGIARKGQGGLVVVFLQCADRKCFGLLFECVGFWNQHFFERSVPKVLSRHNMFWAFSGQWMKKKKKGKPMLGIFFKQISGHSYLHGITLLFIPDFARFHENGRWCRLLGWIERCQGVWRITDPRLSDYSATHCVLDYFNAN